MRLRLRTFAISERGSAAEFAIVFPIFIALTLGAINLGLALYASSTLHFAAQKTARCIAVQNYNTSPPSTAGCMGQAASFYKGPAIGVTFAHTTGGCGNTVTGSGSFTVITGITAGITVPLSASSCYPLQG